MGKIKGALFVILLLLFANSCNMVEEKEIYCGNVRYKYETVEKGKRVYYEIVYFDELNRELHIPVKPTLYVLEKDTDCFELTESQIKLW